MVHSVKIVFFLLSIFFVVVSELAGQSSRLNFKNFTTADGLPSSETYFAFEDLSGLLWVGTDNGLARFDGYSFQVFDSDEGLTDAVVFMIQETSDGGIWVSTLSGRVYYYADNAFHPFQHNDKLLEMKQSSELFYLLDIWPDGTIVMRINYEGIIKVAPSGEITWLTDPESDRYYIYRTRDPGSRHPRQSRYHFGRKYKMSRSNKGEVVVWGENGWEPFGEQPQTLENLDPTRPTFMDMEKEDNGLIVVGHDRMLHLYPDGRKYSFSFRSRISTHLLRRGENEYLMTGIGGQGLVKFELDYEKQEFKTDTFLPGRSLSMATYDHRGGLWITSLDAGLFYCPYPDQEMLVAKTKGLSPRPTAVVAMDSVHIAGTFANGGIILFDDVSKRQQRVMLSRWNSGYSTDDIYYDAATETLLCLNALFRVDPDDRIHITESVRYANLENGMVNGVREFSKIKDTLYWTGTQNYGTIDPLTGNITTRIVKGAAVRKYTHGLESFFIFPDGRRFIGSWYGLKEVLPDNTLQINDLGIPALSDRIERIVALESDRIAIGTRSSGVVILTPTTNYIIGKDEGLASDIIRNLHVTDDGVLWVATLEGLSKIILGKNDERLSVRTFTIGNGLIDNEIHDIDSYRNDLWLASTAGIYKFREPAFDSVSTAPEIQQLLVNGDPVGIQAEMLLSASDNYLSFHYGTTIFSLGDKLRYRYRINPDQPWQITQERVANYPRMNAGEYLFEVQAENQDGVWSSSSMVYLFKDKRWIRTWQPWALGTLLLMGILSAVFIRREKSRRREEEYLLEINRLEHSALHAQMNPHFVFNSLNSIQNFILHNDTRQAATYLARFARLIRQTLRSSVRGIHSLAEEQEMLERYLELEKLRFKDVFEYSVTVDPELPRDDIMLPPLLIQPFVENAILHGFKERSEGGILEVYIGGDEQLLEVSVTDNGVGFDQEMPTGEDSMGMSITRQRLNLVRNRKNPALRLDIQPVYLPDGTVGGTRVTLSIRPVERPSPLAVPKA